MRKILLIIICLLPVSFIIVTLIRKSDEYGFTVSDILKGQDASDASQSQCIVKAGNGKPVVECWVQAGSAGSPCHGPDVPGSGYLEDLEE